MWRMARTRRRLDDEMRIWQIVPVEDSTRAVPVVFPIGLPSRPAGHACQRGWLRWQAGR